MTDMQIYDEGIERFPLSRIILGNALILLWIGLGTIACWFISYLFAAVYLAAAILMLFFVLRKLICTNCYYYGKRCVIGWGKLSALFFRPGSIERFGTSVGTKAAPLTYALLTLTPLVSSAVGLMQEVTVPRGAVLVLFLTVSLYTATINRKQACRSCKMKFICPGSTSK